MTLRIAICGTSNSILTNGYTAGIAAHPAVAHLQNLSLGASTSVVLPKITAENTLDAYDVIGLDFSVNEEFWVSQQTTSLAYIRQILDGFIATLGVATAPAIIIMPTITGLGDILPVHAFYRQYAIDAGYPLFDGFEYVASLAQTRPEQEALFMDRDHLRRDVAYAFGTRIAEQLEQWQRTRPARSTQQIETAEHRYKRFAPAEITGGMQVTRATSLAQAEFARINPESRIVFTTEQPTEIIGIGANLAESNAVVTIKSDQGQHRSSLLTKNYRGDEKGMIFVVTPIKPLSGTRFKIAVEALPDAENATLELAGVSLRSGTQVVDVPHFAASSQGRAT